MLDLDLVKPADRFRVLTSTARQAKRIAPTDEARHHLGDRITYAESNYAALEGVDALVIHTEWQPYRRPDFARMKEAMKAPLVFDGRNLCTLNSVLKQAGLKCRWLSAEYLLGVGSCESHPT